MKTAMNSGISRRDAVAAGSRWLIAGAVVVSAGPMTAKLAAAKVAKADFGYRDKPKGAASCSSCRMFVPGESGKGSCALVDGEVSATGWCMAYSPRQ